MTRKTVFYNWLITVIFGSAANLLWHQQDSLAGILLIYITFSLILGLIPLILMLITVVKAQEKEQTIIALRNRLLFIQIIAYLVIILIIVIRLGLMTNLILIAFRTGFSYLIIGILLTLYHSFNFKHTDN